MKKELNKKYIKDLKDQELISLLIGEKYSKEVGTLMNELFTLSYDELVAKNFSDEKALSILAIKEIFYRIEQNRIDKTNLIKNDKDLYNWIKANIGFSDKEEFFVIFINNQGKILKNEILFKGSSYSSTISVEEIIRKAILYKAHYLVVSHNHPSGNLTPSSKDIEITHRLNKALEMFEIVLLDHVIVTNSAYLSFKKEGLL